MATTIDRVALASLQVDEAISDDRKRLHEEFNQVFGADSLQKAVRQQPLREALIKAGIEPLNTKQVESYKTRKRDG